MAPDGDPSSTPEAPAPDTRVVLTPRSSDSPRVSETPERVRPESTVTYSRDEGESRAQSDDEGSPISVDDTEVAERSLAPSPERANPEGSTSPDRTPEDLDSASYMSSNTYRQWLIDTRAQIWDKFSELNPGWQPRSDGESSDDSGSVATSPDEPPEHHDEAAPL